MFDITAAKPTLLVIDDIPENLTVMYQLFKDEYRVKGANSGIKGLSIAKEVHPDLIILDIMMPGMDGFEVCQHLKSDSVTKDIPVIFLTAKTEKIDEQHGLRLGAVDYITKPINPDIVKVRVRTHVALKLANDLLRGENASLEKEVVRRTQESLRQQEELRSIQDIAFHAMASLVGTRDNETGNHIMRTQKYIKILAERLRDNPLYSDVLNATTIDLIYKSAPLHDIGKIGISDTILLKKGPLTADEFNVMKTHTTIGFNAIQNAEDTIGKSMAFLRYAKEIAHFHHENWDGSGYPLGLTGTEIPLSARLMALADVYDALVSQRVYKSALTHSDAVAVILRGRGSLFDPDIVDAFDDIADDLYAVALRYDN